jgi:hypothetical protein
VEPSPVDPEIAAALLFQHLNDFFDNSPNVSKDPTAWSRQETGQPLRAVVGIPARQVEGAPSRSKYHVLVDASYYDSWPVRITFVELSDDGEWRRARLGTAGYPRIVGSPGVVGGLHGVPFQFALHDSYPFPSGIEDQLVCFSYSFDYYVSGHGPTEDQKWRPGRDRLDATLNRLYTVLNSGAYLGPQYGTST